MVAVRFVATGSQNEGEPEALQQLRSAALQLAEAKGFDQVTVEEITARSGISRRTFFRYFTAKEDVLFSDHIGYLATIEGTMRFVADRPLATAISALEVVAAGMLTDHNFVFRRKALIDGSTVLADRQALWFAEYDKALVTHLIDHYDPGLATITSAALVAALRYALDAWLANPGNGNPVSLLRGLAPAATAAMGAAPGGAIGSGTGPAPDGSAARTEVVIVRSPMTATEIADLITEAANARE